MDGWDFVNLVWYLIPKNTIAIYLISDISDQHPFKVATFKINSTPHHLSLLVKYRGLKPYKSKRFSMDYSSYDKVMVDLPF